ncbi:MAG: ATP-binding protein [Firmicutes bacterium]|nr:ATP-binding protein [Bacillota bacterium]
MKKREILSRITKQLYNEKVIVIFGARRVGKTTLSKQILLNEENAGKRTAFFNAEDLRISSQLETTDSRILRNVIGNVDIAVIDEAQHIKNIGLVLKILNDTYPELQIIATGSSSFDLSNKTGEPLVGRARYFKLYPLSLKETSDHYIDQYANIDQMLVFGGYPSVFEKYKNDRIEELNTIVSGYLYRDILSIDAIRHSDKLVKLLQLLAFQIGNEVSYNELGVSLGMDRATVEKYIDLLEKCFVIFRLGTLSRNLRKEISKNNKIYFYDLGIRNCLIQNFNDLDLRTDIGALWENFCIVERMKRNSFVGHYSNNYFWRTYKQQEIDYIEEYDGVLHAYEFKYSKKAKVKTPNLFLETYPSEFCVVNKENFLDGFFI